MLVTHAVQSAHTRPVLLQMESTFAIVKNHVLKTVNMFVVLMGKRTKINVCWKSLHANQGRISPEQTTDNAKVHKVVYTSLVLTKIDESVITNQY